MSDDIPVKLCVWEEDPYNQCDTLAAVIFLWGCWRCESYTEKFYCRKHWVFYESSTLFDYCGKCKAKTAEYLEHHL